MKLLRIVWRLFMWQWKELGYTYCTTMCYEKVFCFKLWNFKTQAVFFILRLLIKLVYFFISQNTKKSRYSLTCLGSILLGPPLGFLRLRFSVIVPSLRSPVRWSSFVFWVLGLSQRSSVFIFWYDRNTR